MKQLILILFFTGIDALLCEMSCAQSAPGLMTIEKKESNSVTMPAGGHFGASRWKQFWWGKHWRKEWLTPVNFPVLDLDTTAGGLTTKKEGGGKETKTLRVIGENGKEYVLRTIDKSLDKVVPDEFKGSFVNDIANDQISTAHPYSALVVAKLSEGIGILHTNPTIVYVPENQRLGEFKPDFANKLCLFEERPNGKGWEHTVLTGAADDIIDSEKLFEKLRADNSIKTDQAAFLKIRLFDMLINDWDRHDDQWLWTTEIKDGKTIYHPFARDRDQAFSKMDGINMFLISRPWALREFQNMNPHVTDVIGTTVSAVFVDKKFTNELTEADWKQTIVSLQLLLKDEMIENALRQMPVDIYNLSGPFLYERLRSRRDNMMKFGMRYYNILNKHVDITGSDKQEFYTINKRIDNVTEITIQTTTTNNQPGDTIYHRIFNPGVTKTVNIYGFDGDDEFTFTGNTNNKILVRSFGGDGSDSYKDHTDSAFHLKKTPVYDVADDAPSIIHGLDYRPTKDTAVTNYHYMAFKYDWWMPLLLPGYNADDGFVIGTGITYKKQQWNKLPFGWQQTISGNYAASTGAFSLFYKGIFTHTIGKWDLDLAANYKAPSFVVSFYGFGNDTKLVTTQKEFYRVRARSFFINPGASHKWKHNTISTGFIFNTVKVETADDKFISQPITGIDSSVFRTKYFGGANLLYSLNTSDSLRYPTRGIDFHAGAAYMINLKEGSRDYVQLHSSFTFYYSPVRNVTIAHRTGAAINSGKYEFYQANTLGGLENLRGYWRSRFTGQGSFYQNTDIRLKLANLKGYVLRGTLGVYGFFDDGRVWLKEEHSNVLHTGYGGGIYFIPYNTLAINLSYASSAEVNTFTFRTGFLF